MDASSLPALDPGLPGLSPLPELASRPGLWPELARRLRGRPFLRADGLVSELGPPLAATPAFWAACQEIVERFDLFYRRAVGRYAGLAEEERGEYLASPAFEDAIEAEPKGGTLLPISRFDCVLDEGGRLRVIELNPVGVCAVHLRSTGYLGRALGRAGLVEDARRLGAHDDALVATFRRFYDERAGRAVESPTVGVLTLPHWYRGPRRQWRAAFERAGWGFAEGDPRHVEVSADGLTLRGARVDVLWADHVYYVGYQYQRYRETRFPSKHGPLEPAPDDTERILGHPEMAGLLASRRVVTVSPFRAYLALSKGLLSFIHREDRPAGPDRAWLAEHVARTWSAEERGAGVITRAEAEAGREGLLLKPCQYGGSHGVMAGRSVAPGEWRAALVRAWTDPGWVLQAFHVPVRTRDGLYTSFGLYNYGGRIGAVTLRLGRSLVVSARESLYLPIVAAA